jgi:hypothetical protein
LVYVSNAVPEGDGTQNLGMQGVAYNVISAAVSAPDAPGAIVSATSRQLNGLDMFQIVARGLKENVTYTVFAVCLAFSLRGPSLVSYIALQQDSQSSQSFSSNNGFFSSRAEEWDRYAVRWRASSACVPQVLRQLRLELGGCAPAGILVGWLIAHLKLLLPPKKVVRTCAIYFSLPPPPPFFL